MSAQPGWELVTSDRFRNQIVSHLRRRALRAGRSPGEQPLRRAADRIASRVIVNARPSGSPRRSRYGGIARVFTTRLGRHLYSVMTQRAGAGVWSIQQIWKVQEGERENNRAIQTYLTQLDQLLWNRAGMQRKSTAAQDRTVVDGNNRIMVDSQGNKIAPPAGGRQQTYWTDRTYVYSDPVSGQVGRANIETDTSAREMKKKIQERVRPDVFNMFVRVNSKTRRPDSLVYSPAGTTQTHTITGARNIRRFLAGKLTHNGNRAPAPVDPKTLGPKWRRFIPNRPGARSRRARESEFEQPARQSNPPRPRCRDGCRTRKRILINVAPTRQRLEAWEGTRLVGCTRIRSGGTTGTRRPTPTGFFCIDCKDIPHVSSETGRCDCRNPPAIAPRRCGGPLPGCGSGCRWRGAPMRYFLRFAAGGIGIHAGNVGDSAGSHGCVRASVSAARWLFQWAPLGTCVRVINAPNRRTPGCGPLPPRAASRGPARREFEALSGSGDRCSDCQTRCFERSRRRRGSVYGSSRCQWCSEACRRNGGVWPRSVPSTRGRYRCPQVC